MSSPGHRNCEYKRHHGGYLYMMMRTCYINSTTGILYYRGLWGKWSVADTWRWYWQSKLGIASTSSVHVYSIDALNFWAIYRLQLVFRIVSISGHCFSFFYRRTEEIWKHGIPTTCSNWILQCFVIVTTRLSGHDLSSSPSHSYDVQRCSS